MLGIKVNLRLFRKVKASKNCNLIVPIGSIIFYFLTPLIQLLSLNFFRSIISS